MKAPFLASSTLMLVRGIVVRGSRKAMRCFVACACCSPLDASCHHGFAIRVESRQLFEGVGGVRGVDILIGMRQVASNLEGSWCHRSVQCLSRRLNWSTDGFIVSSCLFLTSAYIPAMSTTPHSSTVQLTDQDRAYPGSTFREVVEALFANPYQRVWGREGEPPLPIYEVSLESVFGGLIRSASLTSSTKPVSARGFGRGLALGARWQGLEPPGASERGVPDRTVADHRADRLLRLLRQGSTALAIGRYSTCCAETRRGTHAIAVDGRQALSHDGPASRDAASHRELHHAGGHRRRRHRVSSTTPNCATLRTRPLAPRRRRGAAAEGGLTFGESTASRPSGSCIRLPSSASRMEADAGARVHAPARRRRISRGFPARISTSATRSWRRSSIAAIPTPKRTLTFNIEVTDEGETSRAGVPRSSGRFGIGGASAR